MKYIETVDCIVSTSWDTDSNQPITSLPSLDAFISSFALFKTETLLLEKLLYKNASQHRRAAYFKNLQEVRRLSRLLHQLDMQYLLEEFTTAVHQTQLRHHNKQWQTTINQTSTSASQQQHRKLPTHQSATFILHRLTSGIHLIEALGSSIIKATQSLSSQLAMSFFMPMCLTALACIARLRTLSAQIAVHFVSLYNSIAEVSTVLPPVSMQYMNTNSSDVGRRYYCDDDDGGLPQMVKMTWKTGGMMKLKHVGGVSMHNDEEEEQGNDDDDDGNHSSVLLRRAEDTMARCNVRVVGTKSVEKRVTSTTILNVVEDVGVAIQREDIEGEVNEEEEEDKSDNNDDGTVVYKRARHTLDGSTLIEDMKEEEEEDAMEVDVVDNGGGGGGEHVVAGRDAKEEEKGADEKPAFISIDMLGKKKKTKGQKKGEDAEPEEERRAGWEDWV